MAKKKKNQDFQKVKLKVGRKLPRESSTNTSFKTHSIQIKEQLTQASSTEPTTKRKLKIEDLLSQLQHYNAGSRHGAVAGLRELVTTHPALISQHLAAMLEKVTPLFMDKDSVVRQAVIKLLKVVLSNTDTGELVPFFGILSSHLSCAMTHIVEDIRLDALSVLDVCLEFHPKLIITGTSQLLPNFIDQISQCQSQGSKSGAFSLTINPSGKMGALKWRGKVLERLNRFLSVYLESFPKRTGMFETSEVCHVGWKDDWITCYQPCSSVGLINSDFTFRSSLLPQQSLSTGADYLKNFIGTVVPLLFQCWVEVLPENSAGHPLPVDSHPTMFCVLQILQHLGLCVEALGAEDQALSLDWLYGFYHKDLRQHIQPHFPFSFCDTAKRNRKANRVNVKSLALDLNLCFCGTVCTFYKTHDKPDSRPLQGISTAEDSLLKMAVSYMTQAFPTPHNPDQRKKSVAIMKTLVECCRTSNAQYGLLTAIQVAYKTSHPLSSERRQLMDFFSHVIFKSDVSNHQVVSQWLQGLPEELRSLWSQGEVDSAIPVLHVLSSAVKTQQHNQQFMSSVQVALLELLSHDTFLTLSSQQKEVAEMCYYFPDISRELYIGLAGWCRSVGGSTEDKDYLVQVLMCRYLKVRHENCSVMETSNFISFLLSVLMGTSVSSLAEAGSGQKMPIDQLFKKYSFTDRSPVGLAMAQNVCRVFRQFPEEDQVGKLMSTSLFTILNKYHRFPINTAVGLLHCFSTVSTLPHTIKSSWSVPKPLLSSIVQLMGSLLEWAVGDKEKDTTDALKVVKETLTSSKDIRKLFLGEILSILTDDDVEDHYPASASLLLVILLRDDEMVKHFGDCRDVMSQVKKAVESAESRGSHRSQHVLDCLYVVSTL
ncbi:testis-expressed protein 10 homolog isoform X2 [Lingula anatina]|uniref:Testis-expressed protein 10 homolog isoform X2 n=1 Tax=Lingula anatina TaxID=7574 RepID=A0A1S3ILM7_LINAN|nr:testis-expressed protein 10 homolog isoform X2 [Lingula anatina]|eukprot:XP_013398988.1 testis-expressed protein 10 homolog isoform X2 [Lingula anatina]